MTEALTNCSSLATEAPLDKRADKIDAAMYFVMNMKEGASGLGRDGISICDTYFMVPSIYHTFYCSGCPQPLDVHTPSLQ